MDLPKIRETVIGAIGIVGIAAGAMDAFSSRDTIDTRAIEIHTVIQAYQALLVSKDAELEKCRR